MTKYSDNDETAENVEKFEHKKVILCDLKELNWVRLKNGDMLINYRCLPD